MDIGSARVGIVDREVPERIAVSVVERMWNGALFIFTENDHIL